MICYCKHCVLPDTRPNLVIGEDGICNACKNSFDKIDINWDLRCQEFEKLVEGVKQRKANWDCVIPVSGGKDSTWQVVKAREYGLKPLCVTWKTPARSTIGQKNLDNLIKLGVDHLDISINPEVEKKFTIKALQKKGSVAIPMHMALFALPLSIAIKFRIPLVLWGEDTGVEYGGGNIAKDTQGMNSDWLKKYGVNNNTTLNDWIDEDLSRQDLAIYECPTDRELEALDIKAVFLGRYFPWDPNLTHEVAKKHGFLSSDKPKTGYYKFADIDDKFLITLHHWMKWYKFGFTRLWDNLALEIRNNRMHREQAIAIIKKQGAEQPVEEIDAFCDWIGISKNRFLEISEKFRNPNIWKIERGIWKINNFLISDWEWI